MKRWIILLVIVALTVLFVACEGNQAETDTTSEFAAKDTTVKTTENQTDNGENEDKAETSMEDTQDLWSKTY